MAGESVTTINDSGRLRRDKGRTRHERVRWLQGTTFDKRQRIGHAPDIGYC